MWNANVNFVLLTQMSMDELEQWAEGLRDEAKSHLLQGEQIEVGNVVELSIEQQRKPFGTPKADE